MSNKTRLQTNNTNLQSLIDKANALPDAGSGGVTSWNDLTDKPFGTIGISTLVVDLQELNEKINAGTAIMSSDGSLIKISDAIVTMDGLVNGLTIVLDDEVEVLNIPYNQCIEVVPGVIFCGNLCACISEDAVGVDLGAFIFYEAGFYFITEPIPGAVPYFTNLIITTPGYTGFTVIKTLDPKYLPEITLGLHTDGLLYIFIDGSPVGNGIELPSGSTT